MRIALTRTTLAAALAVAALTLGGCSSAGGADAGADASPSATPSVSQPPSTPVQEQTLTDPVDGTTVTALAIFTDLPSPEGSTAGVRPILVQVRLDAGEEYGGSVFPSRVSITPRDVNLDYMTLGLGNPDVLTTPMSAAGYTPLQATPAGESSTGWIGAWMSDDVIEFDLVYDRPEGKVIGGAKNGDVVAPARDIVKLIPNP